MRRTRGSGSLLPPAIALLRPLNALVAAAAALVGALLAGDPGARPIPVAAAALASFAFAAAGNVRNDVGDVALDRLAHPMRPLARGTMTLRAARTLALALYAAALALSLLVSPAGFALVLLAVPVMEGYERWGKAAGLPGNLAIGALTGAPFLLGALAVGAPGPAALAVAGLAALATVGREILKDAEDEAADRGWRRTLPVRIGARRASAVAAGFLVAAAALSILPWTLETVLGRSYIPAVGVADALFLAAAAVGPRDAARAQRLAKLGMVAALGALALGRLQAESGWF